MPGRDSLPSRTAAASRLVRLDPLAQDAYPAEALLERARRRHTSEKPPFESWARRSQPKRPDVRWLAVVAVGLFICVGWPWHEEDCLEGDQSESQRRKEKRWERFEANVDDDEVHCPTDSDDEREDSVPARHQRDAVAASVMRRQA